MCKVEQHESRWFTTGKYASCATVSGETITFHWDDPACKQFVEIEDKHYRHCSPPKCVKNDANTPGEFAVDKRKGGSKANQSCRWTSSHIAKRDAVRSTQIGESPGQ